MSPTWTARSSPATTGIEYCNGDWIKRTEIPPDRSRIGVFTTLADLSDKRTAALIEEAAKSGAHRGTPARARSPISTTLIWTRLASKPKVCRRLRPHLEAIAAIHDKTQLAAALGETLRADVDALNNTNFHTAHLFGLWVAPGFNDSDHYAAYLLQGGLQLPDREYYLSDSEHMRDIRSKYQPHVSAMLKLAGFTDTDARAERIVALGARHRGKASQPGGKRRHPQGQQHLEAGGLSPPRLRALTGPSIFAAPASASKPASSSGSRPPSPASPRS